MKKIVVAILLLCLAGTLNAQVPDTDTFHRTPYATRNSGSFGKGASLLTICYGIPNSIFGQAVYGSGGSGYSIVGPIKIAYETALLDELGITPSFMYTHAISDYETVIGSALGVRGYYHFNKLIPAPQLDVFTGVGFYIGTVLSSWHGGGTEYIFWGTPTFSVGARYYLGTSFGFYSEVGVTGGSFVDVGVTFRFR